MKRAKRGFQKKKCEQLERDLKCPKKFWKALKKMNVGKARKQGHDLLQVYDEGGVVRSGEEAIEIWRTHFARVLGGDDNEDTKLDDTHTREDVDLSECSQHLYEPISREEVSWALNVVKKDAAPGLDGVVMEMMLTERLLEVWVALFRVCWERERVPTMWRESVVVPVPKKQVRGACDVNTFRGISLTSMVSKVLCKVLENRLSCVVEEKGLIAEEQGGFRKGRGCRDQVLSLVLLGQTQMVRKSTGMLVVFIDFSKAYDKVVREKLWSCLQSMGMSGKFLRFLQALYQGSVCRVKVDGQVSEDFEVNTGLRQGCVLSPLLFSLYINGATKRLQEEKCGVECGEEKVPGLLFADDTCLLAPDEAGLKKSMDVLVEWCKEWGVKINVAKCGIMHIRKKNVPRCEVKYEVDGEAIPMVSSYKYLGCVVDEHMDLKEMVEDKAEAGRRALGACLLRCRSEIGDVAIGIFRKLMESLVKSSMLYGAEIWGCCRNLESIEQVQLRAFRMFFGVGILHPKASLWWEMKSLPVIWEAKIHCLKFWMNIMNSEAYEGRLLRKVAREAVKCGKGVWIRNMAKCMGDFEWEDMRVDAIKGFRDQEIMEMLRSIASRKVDSMLAKELEEKPKLCMMKQMTEQGIDSSCAAVRSKRARRMLVKLRGGTAPFQIEMGRWQGVERERRICKECESEEIEDVCHWLLQCPTWEHLRIPLIDIVAEMDGFRGKSDREKTAFILSQACSKNNILNHLSVMWSARFGV